MDTSDIIKSWSEYAGIKLHNRMWTFEAAVEGIVIVPECDVMVSRVRCRPATNAIALSRYIFDFEDIDDMEYEQLSDLVHQGTQPHYDQNFQIKVSRYSQRHNHNVTTLVEAWQFDKCRIRSATNDYYHKISLSFNCEDGRMTHEFDRDALCI